MIAPSFRRGVFFVVAVALPARAQTLPQDQGAVGTYQKLLKLTTTASVLHTTAHPDDEDGGLLCWLSRGQGVRTSMLTLNRGEAGDNALGPELFDALGLIRTEELRVADRYYGVDRQYFTTVIDYGFSKRLDEALDKWGRESVLRDMVRVIRRDRPFVIISRFQGNARDGHGNHQAAGLLTQEAFKIAGDMTAFPELEKEGLLPWKPLKLYVGTGFFGGDGATVKVDVGTYSPWLGDSYANFARLGLSFQRSQNSGVLRRTSGSVFASYRRVVFDGKAPEKEAGFFDGIDTTIHGVFAILGVPEPEGASDPIDAVDREVRKAWLAFRMDDPSACVPSLVRGMKANHLVIRELFGAAREHPALDEFLAKQLQFNDAILAALGIELSAVAHPVGTPEPSGRFAAFAQPPVMGPVVPGQAFEVRVSLTNRGKIPVEPVWLRVQRTTYGNDWPGTGETPWRVRLGEGETATERRAVTVPDDIQVTRPFFERRGLDENRYAVAYPRETGRPALPSALLAIVRMQILGQDVDINTSVQRREANLPYGYEMRDLEIVPALGVNVAPRRLIVPRSADGKDVTIRVEVLNNKEGETNGSLRLRLPVAGWSAEPAEVPLKFAHAGERAFVAFKVRMPVVEDRADWIRAVAYDGHREYREGYDVLKHRDLATSYLYRPAEAYVRGVDVKIKPDLHVGYIMGIGDEMPAAIAQLGAKVELLDEGALADGDLGRFDAIVTGTRAYAVRGDLKTFNQRLLDYAKNGGNLIVLYNTPEFVPDRFAPFPAKLPGNAEEVSEEDAAVEILAPEEPVFNTPNKITKADFDGWVEQRGSKFLSEWDKAYTALVESHDRGQKPQRGGWVSAKVGKGHYTYMAYALHRQLPYGVPGAYRILANLLSMGRGEP
ncbi:MAG TPA: PIG-L family deacetylase [Isosphaeraceae bacterium]|jgi:LmbE family N-acetylglucosaminyl deacetylase|nr:PIG-L family deacetylase [Isosphaeraceae bacterium]